MTDAELAEEIETQRGMIRGPPGEHYRGPVPPHPSAPGSRHRTGRHQYPRRSGPQEVS